MPAPIVGANSVEQLAELLPAAARSITPEEVSGLDEVSGWVRSRTEKEA